MTQIEPNVQHIAPFNIELISKYIKFPLNFDGFCYVLTANGETIAKKGFNISRETIQDFTNCVNDTYYDIFLEKFDINDNLITDTNLIQFEPNLFSLNIFDSAICHNNVEIISLRKLYDNINFPKNIDFSKNVAEFLTFCCNCNQFDVDLMS